MIYWDKIKIILGTSTARLTISYLAIIMLMSFSFSLVFYNTSYRALGRQLPPPNSFWLQKRNDALGGPQSIDDFLRQRIDEGRQELTIRLVGLNALMLLGGSFVSYYLARRTLKPIEDNIEAQNQFVSDASHELRTPLTVLQTTNEVALRKSSISSSESKDILRHNIAEVVKLRQLTDSLLSLALADNYVLDFTSVDISDIASEALNKVVNSAVKKEITVEDNVPKMNIRGNIESLSLALAIILDNAIKYSPEKSKITLTAEKSSKSVLLSVKDEGIGINAVHLPHIFERFYRADSSRSKHAAEGFGIGLALAKKIIEQHKGEISVASKPGEGSTFTIKIPLLESLS